jgi:diaminopimelate decarboxylase
MKHQSSAERDKGATPFILWPRRLLVFAHEIYVELKRLNRGGGYGIYRPSNSRRQQTQAFKAALAQRYKEHNRCC